MARAAESARQWTAALAGGGVTLALLALALRLPVRTGSWWEGTDRSEIGGTPLQVEWGGNQPAAALTEAAQLMDPNPLFMPTAKSVTSERHGGTAMEERFPGLTVPEAFKFQPGDLRLDRLPPPVNLPASPAEALAANPPGNLALGMGRTDQPEMALSSRQAWVTIMAPSTGKILLRKALPPKEVPELFSAAGWEPISFSANVNAAGLVGAIVPMPGTPASGGFASLDSDTAGRLANYLEQKLLLGLTLEPGFYRISIGP
jgi:hypothetical protein